MRERDGAEKRNRRRDRLVKFTLWVLAPLSLAGLIALRLFVLEAYRVPSSNMFPNVDDGDHLFVSKSAYGVLAPSAPARGDVIAHLLPEAPEDMPQKFVKRVIALPGDELVVDGGHPVVNGWRVPSCSLGTVSSSSNIDAASLPVFSSSSSVATLIFPCPAHATSWRSITLCPSGARNRNGSWIDCPCSGGAHGYATSTFCTHAVSFALRVVSSTIVACVAPAVARPTILEHIASVSHRP